MTKLRWGVIGAGGIADRRTIPGMMLADNAELIAVMDANKEAAERVKEKYGALAAYDNEADLLARDDIDVVYIASPVFCHKPQVAAAAAAKKHILLEKPMGLTVADSEEIYEMCKKAGVKLGIGFMMRYHAYHQKMKELIQSGAIGEIVSCRGQLTCWYPKMEGNWRQDKSKSGGGAMMDMGIHCIDLIQYITGLKAEKVFAFADNGTFGYNADDSSAVLMQMENGAKVFVDANFNIPDIAAKCFLEFYGTKGSILANGTISQVEGGNVEIIIADDSLGYDAAQNRVDNGPVKMEAELGNMYQKEIENFGKYILGEEAEIVTPEEAIFNQKIVETAYGVAETGVCTKL